MSSSTSKPAFVLIPGSFVHAWVYDEQIAYLKSQGFEAMTYDLRTTIGKPGDRAASMYEDAVFFNGVLTRLADEGKDIIVMGHSYGGIVTSESLKDVTKSQREKSGKNGGVIRVIYLAALVPKVGDSSRDLLKEFMDPLIGNSGDFMHHDDPELIGAVAMSDLPQEQATELGKKMTYHSKQSFLDKLTFDGYSHAPVSYILTEADKCVIPELQRTMIESIESASGRKVDVRPVQWDHTPNFSHSEDLSKLLEEIALSA